MAKLTIKELESLTPADDGKVLYEDGGIRGEVRSNLSGISVAFSYRYRFQSKTREIRLGVWPRVSIIHVRKARVDARSLLDQGKDPLLEKLLASERRRAEHLAEEALLKGKAARLSVTDLFDRWERLALKDRKDGGKEIRRMFEKDVLPFIGAIAVEDVKKANIVLILNALLDRGVNRMSKLILSLMRQMFRYAQDQDIIEYDPTSSIRKSKIGGKDTIRDRVLNESEIKELREKLPNAKFLTSTECAIWIMLSTLCRIGELCKAEWAHLDLESGIWKIPKEHSKNGKSHIIYLSEFAKEQFKCLQAIKSSDRWIYPNTDNSNHVYEKSISKQVGDRQLSEDRIKNKGRLSGRSKNFSAIRLSEGKWTPHDLRRTGATLMGNLGVRPDVIEKCLNHVEQNKITRAYQHQTLVAEQAAAWKLLGKHLHLILNNKTNNVSLMAAKAVA